VAHVIGTEIRGAFEEVAWEVYVHTETTCLILVNDMSTRIDDLEKSLEKVLQQEPPATETGTETPKQQ
jgi:hypothetical protein